MSDNAVVHLKCTVEQANTISKALDLYTRIGIGQLEEITWMLRFGLIPFPRFEDVQYTSEKLDVLNDIQQSMGHIKTSLGFSANSGYGIGNPKVLATYKVAYEVVKVIDRAIAIHNNPDPAFKGVNYDGIIIRYTDDPEPTCEVVTNDN
jgi:hypothetical protein